MSTSTIVSPEGPPPPLPAEADGRNGSDLPTSPTPKQAFYSSAEASPSAKDPRRLIIHQALNAPPTPSDLFELCKDYIKTARVAGFLFEDSKTREDLFSQIVLAATTLCDSTYSIEDGRANLTDIREEMARLAEEVRNRRLNEYLAQSVTFGVFPLILGGLTFLTYQILDKQLPLIASLQPAFVWAMTALWITSGSAISLAAEFALRTYGSLSYDQLTNINPSRWQPRQGLYATVLTAFIAAFLLYLDIIQVGLGGVLLNDFDSIDKTYIALLIGGATGLGFTRVRDLIYSASQSIKIADPPQSQSKA